MMTISIFEAEETDDKFELLVNLTLNYNYGMTLWKYLSKFAALWELN